MDGPEIDYPLRRRNAGTAKNANAAIAAEVMLRGHRVKLIKGQIAFPGEDLKMRVICCVPERTFSVA